MREFKIDEVDVSFIPKPENGITYNQDEWKSLNSLLTVGIFDDKRRVSKNTRDLFKVLKEADKELKRVTKNHYTFEDRLPIYDSILYRSTDLSNFTSLTYDFYDTSGHKKRPFQNKKEYKVDFSNLDNRTYENVTEHVDKAMWYIHDYVLYVVTAFVYDKALWKADTFSSFVEEFNKHKYPIFHTIIGKQYVWTDYIEERFLKDYPHGNYFNLAIKKYYRILTYDEKLHISYPFDYQELKIALLKGEISPSSFIQVLDISFEDNVKSSIELFKNAKNLLSKAIEDLYKRFVIERATLDEYSYESVSKTFPYAFKKYVEFEKLLKSYRSIMSLSEAEIEKMARAKETGNLQEKDFDEAPKLIPQKTLKELGELHIEKSSTPPPDIEAQRQRIRILKLKHEKK